MIDDGSTGQTPDGSVRDGFPGQRMRVLPRPFVRRALDRPVMGQLLVTDAGFFPRAVRHRRRRPAGTEQLVVIVCTAGHGTATLPSGKHDLGPGDVVVLPPQTPHDYAAERDEPWTIWWMHVAGRAVADLELAVRAAAGGHVLHLDDPARVVSLLATVLHEMERDETETSLLAASGAAWHALALLGAQRRTPRSTKADPVETALRHLRDNWVGRTSVAELAGMTGLSASHFATLFRRATGFSVLEYQTRVRMGHARELLDTTDRAVSVIAHLVGYADPLYFSRQFAKLHGMAPRAYRRRDDR
ncbi:AraC-like DNA-binding protein [Xylanimonas ulmi]|uniref:AraC-like DNA-binding protein n=2 Tax=Xylanimonas ulmi TaxID=228973 RepID=A0A4Q7LZC9_9MICO|nr:AraC-like DNA-binding protein [Xylanibacterium ulmi]